MLVIGNNTNISQFACIDDSTLGTRIEIGDDSFIDAFVRIRPVGGMGNIIIGKRCYINSGTCLHSGNGIVMGNDVLIGPNCTISGSNHEYKSAESTIFEQRFAPSRGGVIIEDDVWIGANCVLVDGTRIKKGTVIGAGSFVNSETKPYSVCYGVPARIISYRNEKRHE